MQKIKVLGFPGNGLLSNTMLIKALFNNNENIPFTIDECESLAESKRPVFRASLSNMRIVRSDNTITIFEDGVNETISLQWCEVTELSNEYLDNHSHTTVPLS